MVCDVAVFWNLLRSFDERRGCTPHATRDSASLSASSRLSIHPRFIRLAGDEEEMWYSVVAPDSVARWLPVVQQPRAQLRVGLPQKRRVHGSGADRADIVHGALCAFARHGYRHWCEETWRDESLPCHGVLYYSVQVTGLALACPTARLTQSLTDSRLTRDSGTRANRPGTRCLIDLGRCRRVWVRVHWEAV